MTTLSEIRERVRSSTVNDWHKVDEGPTYRSRFEYSTGQAAQWRLREDSHRNVLVYTPDVDLTIAYGMDFDPHRPDPVFKWAEVFADEAVSVHFADIFWRGSLVDRTDYVLVDGARGALPIGGGHDGLDITSYERDVARLLHSFESGFGSFDGFYSQVPFRVTEQ